MIEHNNEKRFVINSIKIKILFLYLVFFSLSIFIYRYYIIPIYGYSSVFIWNLDIYKLIFSVVSVAVIVFLLPSNLSRPTDILLHIQFIFPVFFMLLLFSTENLSFLYIIYVLFSFLLLFFIVKLKIPYIKTPRFNPRFINSLLGTLFIMLMILLVITHINFFNFNLNEVYKYRLILRDIDKGIWGYIWFSFFPIIAGFGLALSLRNRNKLYTIFIIITYMLIFGFTSHKVFLFLPWAIIGFYWILNRKNPIVWLLMSLVVLSVCLIILDAVWLNGWATGLILRRVFLIPSQANYFYYNFFSENPKVFWTDSKWLFLDKIIGYPYDMPIPRIIGHIYFNDSDTNANTGWLGAGYAHAGFIGMAIYAIIIGLILKFLNYRANDLGKEFILVSFFPYISVIFYSGDLKTAFLTHGLALYLILLSLYGKHGLTEHHHRTTGCKVLMICKHIRKHIKRNCIKDGKNWLKSAF